MREPSTRPSPDLSDQLHTNQLARRCLQASAVLALLGSSANLPEILQGRMHGAGEYLICLSVIVEATLLLVLFVFPRIPLNGLAVAATLYFGLHLSAGCLVSRGSPQQASYFLLFFLWFAPLLVFNWLVNRLALAALFGKFLLAIPLLIVLASWPHLRHELSSQVLLCLLNLALSHLMLGIMLEPLTKFRAAYTMEKARVSSMQQEAELVERTAFYDSLTGLPNRSAVKRQLRRLQRDAQETALCLMVIDLDHFQTLNDALGHDVGDALLQQVASRLTALQQPGQTVAHLGGDEFALILEDLPSDLRSAREQARVISHRICVLLSEVFYVGEYECLSSASIGVSLSCPAASAEEMLKQADLGLVRAKAQGRNCACQFAPEMETQAAARATLARDLRRALANQEFSLVYQPQVDADGHLIGAEALIRWRLPSGQMVPPCDFIPFAEEAGLIVPIGKWVLETTCAQLGAWAATPGLEGLTVSINVSVRQLMDPHFVSHVEQTLARHALRGDRLKLEITESAVMERVDEGIARMLELRAKGIRFSLDDFGTGHSSLAYLKRLPLDQLKIDRGFVSGVLGNETDASIARTIILLARSLGIEVIAEGVETEAQRSFLAREGCSRYQGYLFGRPLNTAQFQDFAQRSNELEAALDVPALLCLQPDGGIALV